MIYFYDEFWKKKNELVEPRKVEELRYGDKILIKSKFVEIDDIDEFCSNDAKERFNLDIKDVSFNSEEEEENQPAAFFTLYMDNDKFEICAIPRGTIFYKRKDIN